MRDNPLGVPALAGLLRLIGSAGPLLELAGLAVSVAALINRWLRAPRGSLTRRQITIVAVGAALVLIMITIPGSDGRLSDFLIGLPVFTLIPAAIAFAILRDRLYDLDLVINRSVVYGTLAVLLALGYAGVLTLAGLATGERPTFGVVAAVTAVAVIALPLRAWLQRLTDRLMFGDRGDPYAAVSGSAPPCRAGGPWRLAGLRGQRDRRIAQAGLRGGRDPQAAACQHRRAMR